MLRLSVSLLCLAAASAAASPAFTTSNLRCDGSDFGAPHSPSTNFAIDNTRPTFTWANEHTRRGERQTAFELVVREHRRGGSAATAFEQMPLVWSSGRVASPDSSLTYPSDAPALRSGASYAWSVRYFDSTGAPSAFAAAGPARLHVALLTDDEWAGVAWLGDDKVNLFRASFNLDGPAAQVERVVAYVIGLGYSYVQFNGAPAGGPEGGSSVPKARALTTSPWSNNFHRNSYSTIDMTAQLRQGENVVGVGLGHGWRARNPFSRHDPDANANDPVDKVLRMQVRVTFTNGTSAVVSRTGDGWAAAAGPVTGDSVYDGETYDARLEQPGWDAPGFKPATAWAPAPINSKPPQGVMSAWAAPPVVVDRVVQPIGITNPKPDIYVVDFGVNQAGVCKLQNIKLAAGQSVVLRHGEVMQHDHLPDLKTVDPTMIYTGNLRSAKATDTYIARGDPAGETYMPTMTYHGFRYVEVTVPAGAPAITADDIEMLHFHSAVPAKAKTSFSSDTITKIQALAAGAQRSNMMTVATDCDQRDERLGWMGDMSLSSDSICLNYDCASFANSFVQGMDDEMGSDGSLTDVVPFVRFGGRPADVSWSAAFIQTAWVLWKEAGDLSAARTYYSDFLRQLDNVKSQAAAGLDKMHTPYGDWCPPPSVAGHGQGPKPSSPYTSAFSYVNMVRQTAELAGALGNSSESTRLNAEADALVADFNSKFQKTGPPAANGRTTCAVRPESQPVTLQCGNDPTDTKGGVIEAVTFADYGTPAGACASQADTKGNFTSDPKCGCSAKAMAAVAAACVNQTSCVLSAAANGYCDQDPCYETVKHLSVAVRCSAPAPAPTPPGPDVVTYDEDRMTDYTLALALGAANASGADALAAARARLVALVQEASNHHTSGIIGFKFLFDSLRDAGHEEIALAILEQTDYPSIGFLFANSFEPATENLWELMDAYAEGTGMNSRNHHMWSSYSHYVVQRLGGIAPAAPGYKQLLLEPATTIGLGAANVSLSHAHGATTHAWRRHGGRQCAKAAAGRAATLDCGAAGGVIEAVTFASFGRPRGMCGAFATDAACDAPASVEELERRCVGRTRCDVAASAATFGSPGAHCSAAGGEAWLWAEVRCSAPTQVHTSVTVPVGATATLHLPHGVHGIDHPTVLEGGAPLRLDAAQGVHSVSHATDHAGRDVIAVALGSGSFDFVLKSE